MQFKRIIASGIISLILISNTCTVSASETISDNQIKEATEENIEEVIASVPDINEQITELYTNTAKELGVDFKYIKMIHLIAGGQSVYADKKPNIYNDETISTMKGPMEITGVDTVYQKAPFVECPDNKINRPSKYYLPDAIYSVSYDIVAIMGQRYSYNRNGMQDYFNSLQEDVKQNIVFYEAVLIYTGTPEEKVNNLYMAYEKMIYDKQANENVVETSENGELNIKDKFNDTFNDIGISDKETMNTLAILLSFDKNLAINDNVESIKDEYILPYRVNYTSRENMMIAAASLCGKVRYVWGGGHSGASYIDGINPVWVLWEQLYPKTPQSEVTNADGTVSLVDNVGFGTCIKTSGSWCPLHGYTNDEYHGEIVRSLDDYIQLRADTFESNELFDDKYKEMLSKVNYSDGISVHTLDGLDCSGFASWLYNQITDKYELNSDAKNFTKQSALQDIEFGEELMPGDIFAWYTHIIIIVGKVAEGSKAYVTIEQTTNVLKYGVAYYDGATQSDIDLATQIATEANQLIGGLNEYEAPHVYCMDTVGKRTIETDEETESEESEESDTETQDETEEESEEQVKSSDEINIDDYKTVDVWFPGEDKSDYNPNDEVPSSYEFCEKLYYPDGYTARYYINISGKSEDTEESDSKKETKQSKKTTVVYTTYIGRFKDQFIDETTPVGGVNTPIKDMYAKDIIQYTITKLPISYVSGYNLYSGELFDKSVVSSNLGVTLNN